VRKSLIGLLAAGAAIAMIVGGCGGGDDTTEGTASAGLRKAQFVKQGNAICAKASKELNGEVQKFFKENGVAENERPTSAELTEVAEELVTPIIGQEIEEIRELGAPDGEEKQVDKILSAAEEGVEKGEKNPDSLLEENGGPFAKANELAIDYGLNVCGE
jgi:hypothetical protein